MVALAERSLSGSLGELSFNMSDLAWQLAQDKALANGLVADAQETAACSRRTSTSGSARPLVRQGSARHSATRDRVRATWSPSTGWPAEQLLGTCTEEASVAVVSTRDFSVQRHTSQTSLR
jgi:hypothetical protein